MGIIKVNIYGYGDEALTAGCSNRNLGCSSCRSGNMCKNCNSNDGDFQSIPQLCENLRKSLKSTDISKNVDVNFVELGNKNFLSDERTKVEEVMERGFNPPITVIDGIIRYYGGISNILVYKDVKELLS